MLLPGVQQYGDTADRAPHNLIHIHDAPLMYATKQRGYQLRHKSMTPDNASQLKRSTGASCPAYRHRAARAVFVMCRVLF